MEKYLPIFKATDLNKRPTIKKGEEISFKVNISDSDFKNYRLFFTGETNTYFTWKSECDCWVNYGKIDDSLDSVDSYKAQYCVKLEGCDYPKILYKKILGEGNLNYFPASYFNIQKWQPVMSYLPLTNFNDDWTCGIFIKGENIHIKDGGKLKMTFEIREAQRGVSRHDITVPPSITYEIDFPEGSYDWKEISKNIIIPKATTCSVCVFIEAENFEGNLYLESPFLTSSNGFNILPDFNVSTSQRSAYNWMGQNLSKKEWPCFEISLNGNTFFKGEIFERCHRNSECEVNIPYSLVKTGENEITIKLITEMHDAPPYSINEVALLEEPCHDFDVISCPDVITNGKPFSIALQINKPLTLSLSSDLIKPYDENGLVFNEEGLNALRLICNSTVNDINFTLSSDNHSENLHIERCVEKDFDDKIYTGSSDLVFIKQDIKDYENFLRFYLSHNIGNFITVRPVYRWSGTRKYNPEVFKMFVKLMNKMGMKYVNMTDGREPSGQCSNPPLKDMQKTYDGIESGFLGRQKHEQDGAYNYWFYNDFSHNHERELFYDLMVRNFANNIETTSHFEHAPGEQFFIGEELSIFKHKYLPEDMEGIANFAVTQLRNNRFDNTRHTGPSFMYKYMYQAGFDFVGAESLYGPYEVIIAAMRGATRGYTDTNRYGVHLALQWSTFPHDVPQKNARYMLSLFLAYMHGVTDINCEEGLYHLEEYFSYFNRFDDCCKNFVKRQQEFYKYVSSHTRKGEFYSPFAFIHGRYDGFTCFTQEKVWGKDNWTFSDAEKSWDLLKIFYPVSKLNSIYEHNCPTDKPIGVFTGTPRGNTDIVPIETGKYSRYKALSFSGYNKATKDDLDKIYNYVKDGGTLVMGWPHLSVTTNRSDIENDKLTYINHPLVDTISGPYSLFARDFYNGNAVDICRNVIYDEVLIKTDSGIPLMGTKKLGKGKIFFVNAQQYPANCAVKDIYESIISKISDKIIAEEKDYILCGNDVGFTVYNQDDSSRIIYVLAVDWYNPVDKIRKAVLRVNNKEYDIDVPFGKMLKIAIKDGTAVWSEDLDLDIISVEKGSANLQGYGKTVIKFINDSKKSETEIDFSDSPIKQINF